MTRPHEDAIFLMGFSTKLAGVGSRRMGGPNEGPSSGYDIDADIGDPDIDGGDITESGSGKRRELSKMRRCSLINIFSGLVRHLTSDILIVQIIYLIL